MQEFVKNMSATVEHEMCGIECNFVLRYDVKTILQHFWSSKITFSKLAHSQDFSSDRSSGHDSMLFPLRKVYQIIP